MDISKCMNAERSRGQSRRCLNGIHTCMINILHNVPLNIIIFAKGETGAGNIGSEGRYSSRECKCFCPQLLIGEHGVAVAVGSKTSHIQ